MRKRVGIRFWIELLTGSVTAVLFLLTLIARDWIETLVGWDPDQHSGSVEWLIVMGLLLVTVMLFTAARVEWRRAPTVQRSLQ
jgi:tetrahydromethanopterin S-methyltransferase subunit E